jgi:iron complex outermembrane recepter protein
MNTLRSVLIPIGIAAAMATPAAWAQTADPAPAAAPQATAAAAPAGSAGLSPPVNQLQEVVVTGSLIHSANYVAASPIVTVSAESLKATGQVDLEGSLNQLPEFQPSSGAFLGNGIAELNMYGLGANRNLVLLDGHRLPSADAFGDVDLNLIPQSIVSNVQTITGGASAVYGSDAMSGVVNIITLNHFSGVRADVQYGNSVESDYQTVTASLDMGTAFANDRGHVLVSAAYTSMPDLPGYRRSYFTNEIPSSYIGQGTYVPSATNLPNPATVAGVFAGYGITQPISPSSPLGFNNDGTLFTETGALNYKGPTTGPYAIIGGNVRMPVGQQYIIGLPLNRESIFTKYDYQLNPHVQAYGDVLYVSSEVKFSSGDSLTQFAVPTIPVTNPFIPADLATILASRPNPTASFTYNSRYVDFGQRVNDNTETTSEFLDGLRGDFGGGGNWTWDAYASYDSTNILEQDLNAVIEPQVENLLNAPDGGASLCAGGFDPFGLNNTTNISASCRNYMTATASSYEKLTQLVTQGDAQGPLFTLPAGQVQLAVLADYRRNTYQFNPDEELALGNVEAVVGSSAESGEVGVKEAATQLNIPLLHHLPMVDNLEADLGYRYSDYDTSGGTSTYDGTIKWRTVPSLMVRAGYQHAIRAPNVGELYSAPTGGQAGFGTPPAGGDPCDVRSTARTGENGAQVAALCQATGVPGSVIGSYIFPTTAAATVTTGNLTLTPEVANTYNLGFVFTPHPDSAWLQGFSASIDYYNVKIRNVISTISGTIALDKCYNLDGSNPGYLASNPFCLLVHRDANGAINLIDTPYENLGMLSTDGLDMEFNWNAALADLGLHRIPGHVRFQSNIGWSRSYDVQTLPNSAVQDYIGTIDSSTGAIYPHLRALTTLGYAIGSVTAAVRWHYIGAMDDISVVTNPAHVIPGVSSYSLYDLVGTYDLGKSWRLRAGITNLFNKSAPLVAGEIAGVDAAVYDVVGRSYYVGATVDF